MLLIDDNFLLLNILAFSVFAELDEDLVGYVLEDIAALKAGTESASLLDAVAHLLVEVFQYF